MNIPNLTLVEKSFIEAFGYDQANESLFIKFAKGGFYRYNNVKSSVFNQFKENKSKGKFYHQIKSTIGTGEKLGMSHISALDFKRSQVVDKMSKAFAKKISTKGSKNVAK
jgi:hypothetical protein